jgi:hypothetical protein
LPLAGRRSGATGHGQETGGFCARSFVFFLCSSPISPSRKSSTRVTLEGSR